MMRQLDEKVFVSGQIRPEDVAGLRDQGIAMVMNNRPDGEEPDQPSGAEIEAAAEAEGLSYRSIPIQRGIGPADVEAMHEAFGETDGKVLAYCRSGTRSALAWAVARRREGMGIEDIEKAAASAGVDLAPVAHLL